MSLALCLLIILLLLPLVPLVLITIIVGTVSNKMTKGLFGWAVAVKKVAVGCELWKKLL
jgi:hypothetical protein